MSADTLQREFKRRRVDGAEEQVDAVGAVKKHDRLWFGDGNIILVAKGTSNPLGFRLHRGVLSMHSEVFRDMFSLPSDAADNEMMEGCPVVRLQDCEEDLDLFFTLFYNGAKHPFFDEDAPHEFRDIRAMLYLSFKYEVELIKTATISELHSIYPTGFEAYSSWCAGYGDYLENLELSSNIVAVNLARKFNIPDILPTALLECTIYSLPELLDVVDYGPSGSEQLSPDDARLWLRAVARFEDAATERLGVFASFEPDGHYTRHTHGDCQTTVLLLLQHLQRASVFTKQWSFMPIKEKLDAALVQTADERSCFLCMPCKRRLLEEYNGCRTRLWNELPAVFHLDTT